jgi:hypothetical protein
MHEHVLKQVPLSSVKGTGPDGRILKADIEDYLGMLAMHVLLNLYVNVDLDVFRLLICAIGC